MIDRLTPYERFADRLQRDYGITVTAVCDAPRGYAAETFYVDAAEGLFFLKIMHTPRRQSIFLHGLTVVEALAEAGVDRITRVVKRKDGGLSFKDGEAVCALFERLDGKQHYQYDREKVFRKLAQIYRVSAGLPNPGRFMRESFGDRFIGFYEREFLAFMKGPADGTAEHPEAGEARALLKLHAAFLAELPSRAAKTIDACRAEARQAAFYLTHSDYTGNVMIAPDGTHYLIDFDESLFGPIERDGFMILAEGGEDGELFQAVMAETIPGYEPNETFIRYYLFDRFMIDLATFMDELVRHPDPAHRRKVADSTRDYLLAYLYPLLRKYA